MAPDAGGLAFLASAMPMATASVDRLSEVPARLAFLFDYDAGVTLDDDKVRHEMRAEGARAVVEALAEELAAAPRLDREQFRDDRDRVKARPGRKGKRSFIRFAWP